MPPSLRRILAIYFEDAISQAGPGQLESFVTQFLRSPKMKSVGIKLASRLSMMASAAVGVWAWTFSNPPSLRRSWIKALSAMIQHYIPIFEKMGLHGEVRYLHRDIREISLSLRGDLREAPKATDSAKAMVQSLLKEQMAPRPLFIDVARFEKMYEEMQEDARDFGWGEDLGNALSSFRGPLGELYSSWMRPRGTLEYFSKHLPEREWVFAPGESGGLSAEEFFGSFSAANTSDVASWLDVTKALKGVVMIFRQILPYTPIVQGDAVSELLADLSYLGSQLLRLSHWFSNGDASDIVAEIRTNLLDIDKELSAIHPLVSRGGIKPRGAEQANLANRGYAKLAVALKELDNRSLYLGGLFKRMLEQAPDQLDGRELDHFRRILKDEIDIAEVTSILEGVEDRTEAVLAQNPLAI